MINNIYHKALYLCLVYIVSYNLFIWANKILSFYFNVVAMFKFQKLNLFRIIISLTLKNSILKLYTHFQKLKINLPHDVAITLGHIPKGFCILLRDACSYTAVLSPIVRKLKHPIFLSTHKQIMKMWCICTLEYYSSIKKTKPFKTHS